MARLRKNKCIIIMSLEWGKKTKEKGIDAMWRAFRVVKESISVR